ncbi:MAG: CBS domain-containing protein [Nitrospira sp.]|nr:CBS domain-containing protein [Nitrospira sp.]
MSSKHEDPPNTVDHRNKVVAHMMTPGVVQIPGDISVTEAALLLERERMPCLLVKDEEACFGLMTPTDIVKKVVAQGLEPDDIEVRTIMTRPVQFIEYDRMIDEASALMMTSGMPILIVTKQEQPVGVLTARDLIMSPKQRLTHIPAAISVVDGDRSTAEHRGIILQLSHVGALLESQASLLPETSVIVTFALPGLASPLTAQGRILSNYHRSDTSGDPSRTSSATIDIQFTALSPADQSRIKTWTMQHEAASANPT